MDLSQFSSRRAAADQMLEYIKDDIRKLTQRLIDGDISLELWQSTMKDELRLFNSAMSLVGAGGDPSKITRADRLRLGPELRRQYAHLAKFAQDIADGKLPDLRILSRAEMYANSTQASFWRKAMPIKLPAVPRDGSSDCKTNCLCRWRIEYEYDGEGNITAVLAYWEMSEAEHCETCKDRASDWNPLRIEVEPGFVPDIEET